MRKSLLVIILAVLSLGGASAEPPHGFDAAKRVAIPLWFEIGPVSLYCGCPYRVATEAERALRRGGLWVETAECGYIPRVETTRSGNPNARALRIEWEHVVPAEFIATGFGCQNATRADCQKIEGFELAEGDLFNLFPAIGELNADRSSRPYGVVEGEPREYGRCDFELTKEGPREIPSYRRGRAEPAPSIRGDLARIWFYMARRYSVKIGDENLSMYTEWAQVDPIDEKEAERVARIALEMNISASDFYGE